MPFLLAIAFIHRRPLLELFDKRGVTVRDDNTRMLGDRWRQTVLPETLAALDGVSGAAEVPPS